jgi:hypothetical protein
MKIHPVGADLVRADRQVDRQTDRRDEANSRFSQFCEINRFCTIKLVVNCFPVRPLTLNSS